MGVSFLSRMIWFSYLERAGCHGRDLDRRAHLIRRGIRQREWHACINRVVQAAGGGREGVFGVDFARHLGTLRPAIQTIERQAHIPADGPNQRRREARDMKQPKWVDALSKPTGSATSKPTSKPSVLLRGVVMSAPRQEVTLPAP